MSWAQWLAAQDALKLKPCYLADRSHKPQAGLLLTCRRGTRSFLFGCQSTCAQAADVPPACERGCGCHVGFPCAGM